MIKHVHFIHDITHNSYVLIITHFFFLLFSKSFKIGTEVPIRVTLLFSYKLTTQVVLQVQAMQLKLMRYVNQTIIYVKLSCTS